MKVLITEAATHKIAAEVPISFGMALARTTEKDVFDEAWKSAVEDGLVDPKQRSQYKFELTEN